MNLKGTAENKKLYLDIRVSVSKKKPTNRKIIADSDSSDTEPCEPVLSSDSEDASSELETEEVEEAPVKKGEKKSDLVKQTTTMKEILCDAQHRGVVLAGVSILMIFHQTLMTFDCRGSGRGRGRRQYVVMY